MPGSRAEDGSRISLIIEDVARRNAEPAIEDTLLRALAVALLPTIAIILGIGSLFAQRASRRLASVHDAIARIMLCEIEQRLPAAPGGDEIDRIAEAVKLMLDEIVRLSDIT
jgi:hypothetical protein